MESALLNTKEIGIYAKKHFGIAYSRKYLAKLRCIGEGPAYKKIGNRVYYLPSDLQSWISDRLVSLENTSQDKQLQATKRQTSQAIAHNELPNKIEVEDKSTVKGNGFFLPKRISRKKQQPQSEDYDVFKLLGIDDPVESDKPPKTSKLKV